MAVVSMKHLLEAGVHFGHQTRRWNPKMKKYIFTERNGIYIIDLQKTLALIEVAYNFIRERVALGGSVLFVGTKKQAQESIEEHATRCGMPYVNQRWLGGTLTNWVTISKRIDRMKELEEMESQGEFGNFSKKEAMQLRHELSKLRRTLHGLRNMTKLPEIVYIIDPRKEHIAVREARKMEIPIVAIVDTNCDPDEIDFVIPGNDDAIRAGNLISQIIANAVLEGLEARKSLIEPGAGMEEELRAEDVEEEKAVSREVAEELETVFSASPDDGEAEERDGDKEPAISDTPEEISEEEVN